VLPNYETTPEINIYAVFPPNRHLSTKVRLFVNWLADGCKALPWECNL
jgi:DNA-binding transcriptional LysR family regulator